MHYVNSASYKKSASSSAIRSPVISPTPTLLKEAVLAQHHMIELRCKQSAFARGMRGKRSVAKKLTGYYVPSSLSDASAYEAQFQASVNTQNRPYMIT